ncbi:MAG: hypothetical protein ACTSXG_04195, partial [Alphaproteobacteria bacterium]
TLIKGTFAELEEAYYTNGFETGILDFPDKQALIKECKKHGNTKIFFQTEKKHFKTTFEFLKQLKNTGAHCAKPDYYPISLYKILNNFKEGITVTYVIAYCIISKTNSNYGICNYSQSIIK